VFEPSSNPPPDQAPPPPPAAPKAHQGRALKLLAEVRAAQGRSLWTQGVLGGAIVFLVCFVGGAALAHLSVTAARVLLVLGAFAALALVVGFGVLLPRRRVGNDERTARLLAEKLPELNLDLLAAVELSRALGRSGEDFSPELAKAFLRDVDARAARLSVNTLIDQRPVRRVSLGLVATVFALLAVLLVKGASLRAGLAAALTFTKTEEVVRRQPITGDIELTYRYPVHTGLEPRTIAGSTGDVSAPAGTEVTIRTRADRDVDAAALLLSPSGTRVPLKVDKRELTGSFVLSESGQYHVAFLDGSKVKAEGPDQSITVEADQAPQVRVSAPLDNLELDPRKQAVTVKFEASDDYGLASLELVYTPQGGQQARVSLKPDDGRTTRGSYQWDLAPLGLTPGQTVTWFLEATDNDSVKGPKKGTSSVLRLKLYSSAEHRQEALEKTEALWHRLIDHLADRMESPDRASPTPLDAAVAGKPIDERGGVLAGEFGDLAKTLEEDPEPQRELIGALLNVGSELKHDVSQVNTNRSFLLRLTGRIAGPSGKTQFADNRNGSYTQDLQRRVAASIATDIAHAEKNVLYLEALLDRARMDAIKELVKQLREDRRQLTDLLDEFRRTKDPNTQQQLLDQMQALKMRMLELNDQIARLSRNLHDEFMNADAVQQMQEEMGMQTTLEDVEKLIKEGKADEAMKAMQELSMKMDELLDGLDKAEEEADERADPELSRQWQEFGDNLDDTVKKQEALSEKTRALRDKYRQQQKERIAKQGEALKKELKEKLDDLEKDWSQLDNQRLGFRFDEPHRKAMASRDNVEQSLEASDFDLASDAANEMEDEARKMAEMAREVQELEERYQNPPESRRESRQMADRLAKDAKKAAEVAEKLRDLFPQPGQQMNDQDRAQMNELARQQKQLQQQAQQLQQQMDSINERAPLFDEDSMQQAMQAGQKMQGAGERLQGKDASRGYGEQQGALQSLQGLQEAMKQGQGKGGKGIPLPMRRRGSGRGTSNEKVEIQDEDPSAASREFRKDVMDAMKQGAPDRYRDQNKKYYEELVK